MELIADLFVGTRDLERFNEIVLCNALYKILTKLIANRLKPLLP